MSQTYSEDLGDIDEEEAGNFLRAAEDGDEEGLRIVMERPEFLDIQDEIGNFAIHLAALGSHVNCVELLAESGCDINAVNDEGNTPLILATICLAPNARKCCELLIQLGADPEIDNLQGCRALHYASGEGNMPVVELLVTRSKVNVKAVSNDMLTPLLCAMINNRPLVSSFLIHHEPGLLSIPDSNGDFPLHFAVLEGLADMVETLLAEGADALLVNSRKETPLTVAIDVQADEAIVKMLQEAEEEAKGKGGAGSEPDPAEVARKAEQDAVAAEERGDGVAAYERWVEAEAMYRKAGMEDDAYECFLRSHEHAHHHVIDVAPVPIVEEKEGGVDSGGDKRGTGGVGSEGGEGGREAAEEEEEEEELDAQEVQEKERAAALAAADAAAEAAKRRELIADAKRKRREERRQKALERKAARKPAAAAKPKILLEGDLDVDDSKNSKIAHKTAWKAMKSSVMMKSTTWTQRYFILWTDKLQVFSSKSEIRAVPLSTLSLKGRTVKGDGKESKEKRFRISLSESGAGADDGVEMGTKDIKQHKKWADALKGALECLHKEANGQEGESGGEMTSSSGLDLDEEEEEAVEEGAGLKGVLDVDVHVQVPAVVAGKVTVGEGKKEKKGDKEKGKEEENDKKGAGKHGSPGRGLQKAGGGGDGGGRETQEGEDEGVEEGEGEGEGEEGEGEGDGEEEGEEEGESDWDEGDSFVPPSPKPEEHVAEVVDAADDGEAEDGSVWDEDEEEEEEEEGAGDAVSAVGGERGVQSDEARDGGKEEGADGVLEDEAEESSNWDEESSHDVTAVETSQVEASGDGDTRVRGDVIAEGEEEEGEGEVEGGVEENGEKGEGGEGGNEGATEEALVAAGGLLRQIQKRRGGGAGAQKAQKPEPLTVEEGGDEPGTSDGVEGEAPGRKYAHLAEGTQVVDERGKKGTIVNGTFFTDDEGGDQSSDLEASDYDEEEESPLGPLMQHPSVAEGVSVYDMLPVLSPSVAGSVGGYLSHTASPATGAMHPWHMDEEREAREARAPVSAVREGNEEEEEDESDGTPKMMKAGAGMLASGGLLRQLQQIQRSPSSESPGRISPRRLATSFAAETPSRIGKSFGDPSPRGSTPRRHSSGVPRSPQINKSPPTPQIAVTRTIGGSPDQSGANDVPGWSITAGSPPKDAVVGQKQRIVSPSQAIKERQQGVARVQAAYAQDWGEHWGIHRDPESVASLTGDDAISAALRVVKMQSKLIEQAMGVMSSGQKMVSTGGKYAGGVN